MIADCETCDRKKVPCRSCEESQRAICYRCDGDVDDPYCEIEELGLYQGGFPLHTPGPAASSDPVKLKWETKVGW